MPCGDMPVWAPGNHVLGLYEVHIGLRIRQIDLCGDGDAVCRYHY